MSDSDNTAPDNNNDDRIAAILSSVAKGLDNRHKHRIAMLLCKNPNGLSVSAIGEYYNEHHEEISQPLLSKNLKDMAEAGLIEEASDPSHKSIIIKKIKPAFIPLIARMNEKSVELLEDKDHEEFRRYIRFKAEEESDKFPAKKRVVRAKPLSQPNPDDDQDITTPASEPIEERKIKFTPATSSKTLDAIRENASTHKVLYVDTNPPTEADISAMMGGWAFQVEHRSEMPEKIQESVIIIDARGKSEEYIRKTIYAADEARELSTAIFVIGDKESSAHLIRNTTKNIRFFNADDDDPAKDQRRNIANNIAAIIEQEPAFERAKGNLATRMANLRKPYPGKS